MVENGLKGKDWTQQLFVKRPELFLPWMESMKARTPAEIGGLRTIFEKFGIREGARVLDLASGIGRMSVNLAKAGFEVVGVDISPFYLEYAERWARKENVADRVQFYRFDMRDAARQLRKKGEEKFDAIINFGTSMGYYGEKEDVRTFKSLLGVTSSRAILVIDTVNRDYLVKNFREKEISVLDDIEWHEFRKLNLENSHMENNWRFYRKTRESLRLLLEVPVSHRVYSLHELKQVANSAGWKYLESYGSTERLTPVTADSFHMTLVGRKQA
jgi:cyclopropane fatty-acyl-phospholipid synthase-like methyltransferase